MKKTLRKWHLSFLTRMLFRLASARGEPGHFTSTREGTAQTQMVPDRTWPGKYQWSVTGCPEGSPWCRTSSSCHFSYARCIQTESMGSIQLKKLLDGFGIIMWYSLVIPSISTCLKTRRSIFFVSAKNILKYFLNLLSFSVCVHVSFYLLVVAAKLHNVPNNPHLLGFAYLHNALPLCMRVDGDDC